MKQTGCSILFVNDRDEILLFLRDDDPDIPYPNMWDIPGGHLENGETPEQCIVREIQEEMGLCIEEVELFSITTFAGRTEYTFWKKVDLDIERVQLVEGQCLRWFTKNVAKNTALADGFNQVVEDFFEKTPYR